MTTLTWGEIPDDLTIDKPYAMELNSMDASVVANIVNEGIDSHLEAVFVQDLPPWPDSARAAITKIKMDAEIPL